MRSSTTLFLGLLAAALVAPAAVAQNHTLAPIVLRNDPAPGTATTFAAFELPFSITEGGVAFVADLFSVPGSGDAVYADVGAGLELVALDGQPAPGIPGMDIVNLRTARLNAAGSVVFGADVWNGTDGLGVLYRWTGGTPTVLVKEGDPAPGGPPGITFSDPYVSTQNEAGDVAFVADTMEGPSTSYQEGIFLHSGGVVTPLVWESTVAPGTAGGMLRSLRPPVLNDSGDLAFAAGVGGGSTDHGLFLLSGGVLEKLVLEGDVLPGTGGGTADWLDVSRIDMDDDGTVAFVADIVGGSVDRGIFTAKNGVITPVVLEGDPAPGAPGTTIDFLRRNLAIDEQGRVAYRADLVGGSASQGLFRGGKAVALIGDTLPGTGGGSVGVMEERPDATASGGVGFASAIFQGVGGRGLFRATPPMPAVPALPACAAAGLALLLAGWGARRLG